MREDFFLQQHSNAFNSLSVIADNELNQSHLNDDTQVIDYSERIYKMSTPFLNKRYEGIVNQAQQNNDTVNLFKLIVHNSKCLLNTGVNLHLLIQLVLCLSQGKKIDADQLDNYLKETRLAGMAQYLGELIVLLFSVDADSVVFMKKKSIQHKRMIEEDLHDIFIKRPNDWFFTQSNHVFVKASDTHAMYQQFGKTMKYFFFAPVESFTNLTSAITHSLAHIEE